MMLALGALSAFLVLALSGSLSTHQVEEWVDDVGWAGPLVFILLSSLLTVVCFPGPLLAGAAGLLFGTALGTPTALIAATLGATLACARRPLRRGRRRRGARRAAHPALAAWVARRGFVSVLYARLAPGVPYNLVNYACGLTTIPLGVFALATAIGTAPRTFAYVALGGSFGDLGSPEALIAIGVLVGDGGHRPRPRSPRPAARARGTRGRAQRAGRVGSHDGARRRDATTSRGPTASGSAAGRRERSRRSFAM